MALNPIWQTLGIARTHDRGDIRRAYARKLKVTNPEDDPEGFKALRAAYEHALAQAGRPDIVFLSDIDFTEAETPTPLPLPATVPIPAPVAPQQAPPPPVDTFQADLNRLEALVRAPGADPDAMTALLASALKAPAMDDISLRVATELRIANLLLYQSPRSDPLLRPAIAFFGWEKAARQVSAPWFVAPILRRDRDQGALKTLKAPDNDHYRAWQELTAPPKPLDWRRRLFMPMSGGIRDLLTYIRKHHPTIENDLNSETVAAWEDYFSRPRLDAWTLWSLIFSLPCLMVIAWLAWAASPELLPLIIFPALVPMMAAVLLICHLGYVWPRHLWQRGGGFTAIPILRYGWGATGLAALALSVAPPSWPFMGASGVLSLLTVLWSASFGEADRRRNGDPWNFRVFLNQMLLIIWWGVSLWQFPFATQVTVSAAVIACIFATGITKFTLFRLWTSAGKAAQLSLIALLAVLAVAAGALLLDSINEPDLTMWAFAAIASLVLVCRAPLLPVTASGFNFLWRFAWIGLIAFSHGAGSLDIPWLFIGGLLILGWTLLTLIGAFNEARKA